MQKTVSVLLRKINITLRITHITLPFTGVGFGRIYWKWILYSSYHVFFFLLVHKRGEAGPLNRIWRGPLTFLMPP